MKGYTNASKAARELNLTDDEFMYILIKYKNDIHIKYIYEEDIMIVKSQNGEFKDKLGKGKYIDRATFSDIFDTNVMDKSNIISLLEINSSDFNNFKLKFKKEMIDKNYIKEIIKNYIDKYYKNTIKETDSYIFKCTNPFSVYSTLNKYCDEYDDFNMNCKISYLLERFIHFFPFLSEIKNNIGHQGSIKDKKRYSDTEKICILINENIKKYKPGEFILTNAIYKREVQNNYSHIIHMSAINKYWGEIDKSYKLKGRISKEDLKKTEYKFNLMVTPNI